MNIFNWSNPLKEPKIILVGRVFRHLFLLKQKLDHRMWWKCYIDIIKFLFLYKSQRKKIIFFTNIRSISVIPTDLKITEIFVLFLWTLQMLLIFFEQKKFVPICEKGYYYKSILLNFDDNNDQSRKKCIIKNYIQMGIFKYDFFMKWMVHKHFQNFRSLLKLYYVNFRIRRLQFNFIITKLLWRITKLFNCRSTIF